jgi:hypothetical protein
VLRQREPRYENRKLLDLAHETPCMAQFEHDCNGYLGCVPAHENSLAGGHGMGKKADDQLHAAVCPNAHDILDGRKGGWDLETKRSEWTRAHRATWRYYWTNGKVVVK